MPDLDWALSLGGLFSRLGTVRKADAIRSAASPPQEPAEFAVVNSRALRRFVSYLGTRPAPVLLDLGPVVGPNVTFFGEHLNCKVYIEDLFADLDRHLREGRIEELPAFLSTRFVQEEGAVDGVLMWDIYDYLDRPSAQALASALVRLLRVGGSLLGYFGGAGQVRSGFTKFVVADESHVQQHTYASSAVRRDSLPNRDIIRMFDGLSVSESFLLRSGLREVLFRKPAAPDRLSGSFPPGMPSSSP